MSEEERKVRLERMAELQGLKLEKSRRRDRRALDFGLYTLINERLGDPVLGGRAYTATLDDIEAYLTRDGNSRAKPGAAAELTTPTTAELFAEGEQAASQGREALFTFLASERFRDESAVAHFGVAQLDHWYSTADEADRRRPRRAPDRELWTWKVKQR